MLVLVVIASSPRCLYPVAMSLCAADSRFFALNESRALGLAVAQEAGLVLAPLEERAYTGGEFKLRPLESVRDRPTFVLQALAGTDDAPLSERLLRVLFLLSALRDAGATPRVLLLPYLAFARQERRTQPRDPVNNRYVAQLLEAAGNDQIITLDVHSSTAIENAFRVPVDHLTALPLMVNHYASNLGPAAVTVLSPDIGGIKRAQLFREMLAMRLEREVEFAFIEKRRTEVGVSSGLLVGNASGREAIVLDDLCATGETLMRAAAACRRAGAARVHVAVTHMPLTAGFEALMAADEIASILTTDSVGFSFASAAALRSPHKLSVLSIAPLLGQAIQRRLAGRPLTPLLSRWPVKPED
jgi:ribose-phosphate pyrophosphokinase